MSRIEEQTFQVVDTFPGVAADVTVAKPYQQKLCYFSYLESMAVVGCEQQQIPITISHAVAVNADSTFTRNEVHHFKETILPVAQWAVIGFEIFQLYLLMHILFDHNTNIPFYHRNEPNKYVFPGLFLLKTVAIIKRLCLKIKKIR